MSGSKRLRYALIEQSWLSLFEMTPLSINTVKRPKIWELCPQVPTKFYLVYNFHYQVGLITHWPVLNSMTVHNRNTYLATYLF